MIESNLETNFDNFTRFLGFDFEKKRPCTTATVPKVSHFQGHHLILSSKVIDLKAVTDAVRGEGHAGLAQRKAAAAAAAS